MHEQIEILALEKDFAALNAAERALVLSEMPEAEYMHMRAVLLASRGLDAGLQPSAALKSKLMARMATKSKPGGFSRVLSAKMPIWQAAAAVLIGVVWVSLMQKEKVQERIVTQIQQRTDTVFQEKVLWRERIVYKERVVIQEKDTPEPIAVLPQFPQEKTPPDPLFSPADFAAPRLGTALSETPELMRFFTEGDR